MLHFAANATLLDATPCPCDPLPLSSYMLGFTLFSTNLLYGYFVPCLGVSKCHSGQRYSFREKSIDMPAKLRRKTIGASGAVSTFHFLVPLLVAACSTVTIPLNEPGTPYFSQIAI